MRYMSVILLLIFGCFLEISYAVEVKEEDNFIIVKTTNYELWWRKSAPMGYAKVILPDCPESLIGSAERTFYHASDYAGGWKRWGEMKDFEILKDEKKRVTLKFKTRDTQNGGCFEYTLIATYSDISPYIKHQVNVQNVGGRENLGWPCSGYDPMFEPHVPISGKKAWKEPIPHCAYWTECGFGALYTKPPGRAKLGDWHGEGDMIQLDHDLLIKLVNPKESSDTIVYWVAFGKGGEKEAHQIAQMILKEPEPRVVTPTGKMALTWADIKTK
ncbi:TPA: hypothetical protein EYP37_12905 [Candidatus Poribacteria bacterium]|nr:hypothetical protein [Candidatus Poribacteria bacterium]